MGFDPLLDQPERMLGLVVEVSADLLQDLWGHVGEVITGVGATRNLHRPGRTVGAEDPAGPAGTAGPEPRREGQGPGLGPGTKTGQEHHEDRSMELEKQKHLDVTGTEPS